jgi:hypothetical protein
MLRRERLQHEAKYAYLRHVEIHNCSKFCGGQITEEMCRQSYEGRSFGHLCIGFSTVQ